MTSMRQRRPPAGKRDSGSRPDDGARGSEKPSADARQAAPPADIVLTAVDFYSLVALAADHAPAQPDLLQELADELERAEVLPFGSPPEDLVALGSEVTFRNRASGFEQALTLVLPDESDALFAKISVLSPIGLALIGRRVGASAAWSTSARHMHHVTVTAVRNARCPEPEAHMPAEAVN